MKMMRRISFLFITVILLNCFSVAAVPVTDSCMSLDAQTALAGNNQLLPTAQAVVLYAPDSDTMVYSWRPDAFIDPSGMNKIMTALIAVESGNLDSMVTATSTALNSVEIGAMSAGLKVGETLTLRDLLYLMMVGSANDAAAVIAEHLAGSQAAFVAYMNQRAAELGCTNTNFLNPSGLSVEGQYTTARDLAKISSYALKLETFAEVFSAIEYTVPASDKSPERRIVTTNYMMSDASVRDQLDNRVTGGKTGALSTTERSLISTAEDGGQRYLAVVMSAKGTLTSSGTSVRTFGNFSETKLLLDHAFSQYAQRQLLSASKVMAQFKIAGGENDLAVAASQSVSALMPNDMKADEVIYRCIERPEKLVAPIISGSVVGTVELWYDNICVAQSDLVAMHGVKEEGTSSIALKPQNGNESGTVKTTVVVCLLIFAAVIILLISIAVVLRAVRIRQHHKRSRFHGRK